ncbi:MAG: hypothetical protein ABI760_17530, partial [Ferruginibacter sp.]
LRSFFDFAHFSTSLIFRLRSKLAKISFDFAQDCLPLLLDMLPDYPHKIFSDKRTSYTLLMLALAMDTMR